MTKPPPKPEEKLEAAKSPFCEGSQNEKAQRDLFVAINSMPHAAQRANAMEIIGRFFAALKPLPRPTRH